MTQNNAVNKIRIPLSHLFPVIAGCGLIGTSLGMCVNISGNFFTPVAEAFSCGRADAAMTLTVYNIVQAAAALYAPRVLSSFRLKQVLLFCTILQAGSTFLLSRCMSIPPMLILNALRGIGSAMIGTVMVTMMINYWFHEKTALMISIPLGFSGIVGAIFSPLIASVIAQSGWRTAYQLCALLILFLNLTALLLPIGLRPEDVSLAPYGTKEKTANADDAPVSVSPRLLALMIVFAFACSVVSALPHHFPGIAENLSASSIGALLISAGMVSNTGGKILLGALIDRIGTKNAASLFLLLIGAGALLLLTLPYPLFLIAAAFLFGLSFSVSVVATSTMSRECFGPAGYSRYFPTINFTATFANAVGTWLIGRLYDESGSYTSAVMLVFVLILVSLGSLRLVHRKP